MYSKIVNPSTGRKVSTNSKLGKKILMNFMNQLEGGGRWSPGGAALNRHKNRSRARAMVTKADRERESARIWWEREQQRQREREEESMKIKEQEERKWKRDLVKHRKSIKCTDKKLERIEACKQLGDTTSPECVKSIHDCRDRFIKKKDGTDVRVGNRVNIWWNDDQTTYSGQVSIIDDYFVQVLYDDGDIVDYRHDDFVDRLR